jgi:hypothetical protein
VSHITTTAFHPQSNGLLERFHRRLKATLRARCASPDWVAHLLLVLLSYRCSPHDATNLSPAEAVFGTPLILPAQFPLSPEDDSTHFLSQLQRTLSGSLSSSSTTTAPRPRLPADLLHSSDVFVRSPLHILLWLLFTRDLTKFCRDILIPFVSKLVPALTQFLFIASSPPMFPLMWPLLNLPVADGLPKFRQFPS